MPARGQGTRGQGQGFAVASRQCEQGAGLELGWLSVLVVLAVAWAPARPVSAQSAADDLPIFDAHIHYNRDAWGLYSVDDALALLDQAGVRKAFVSSTPDDGTLMLYARAPDRIVPSLRPTARRPTSSPGPATRASWRMSQTSWTTRPPVQPTEALASSTCCRAK